MGVEVRMVAVECWQSTGWKGIQMSGWDEENVITNVYIWLKTNSAVELGRRRLPVNLPSVASTASKCTLHSKLAYERSSSGIPAIRTHHIPEFEERRPAHMLPRLLCQLPVCLYVFSFHCSHSISALGRTLIHKEMWKSTECWNTRDASLHFHWDSVVYCSAPQNSQQMSYHQWAHQICIIHSEAEKTGGQFHMDPRPTADTKTCGEFSSAASHSNRWLTRLVFSLSPTSSHSPFSYMWGRQQF